MSKEAAITVLFYILYLSTSIRLNQSTAIYVTTNFSMNKMKKSIISATIRFQSGGIENSCHSIAGGCWSFLCSVAAGTGAAAEAAEAV